MMPISHAGAAHAPSQDFEHAVRRTVGHTRNWRNEGLWSFALYIHSWRLILEHDPAIRVGEDGAGSGRPGYLALLSELERRLLPDIGQRPGH